MEYRILGRTGVEVSCLALGCMNFGGKTNESDSFAIIDRALADGINFLDTSNSYNHFQSEVVTGNALARDNKRQQVVLATKFSIPLGKGPNMGGASRRFIIEQCEQSLRRLRTDHIDLYQIHRPHPKIPIDETLRALDDLVRSGKVRYLGTSTFAAWQIVEALWVSEKYLLNRFISEQPPYSIVERRAERELIPMAQTYGTAIIPWSPLAAGLLTGKYGRNKTAPEDSRYLTWPGAPLEKARWVEPLYDALEQLEPMAAEKGCTLSQLALAWCLHQPGVTSPIVGPRTLEQYLDNLGALTVDISADDRKRIDRIVQRGSVIVPYYEADFGPHPHRV
jgi:aryl-alcohol dehydrogenase-like predicted oxidoreductase